MDPIRPSVGRVTLNNYSDKRDFRRTPEPPAEPSGAPLAAPEGGLEARQFVVHMHDATRRHYDLRLELDGVLKCWAVPKGPSLDPSVKRLAVHTEDHPLAYLSLEGVIPKGEYGGGPMLVWDRGLWFPVGDVYAGYAKGHLRIRLEGTKVRGVWNLVKTSSGKGGKQADKQWMLIKSKDAHAHSEAVALVDAWPRSVRTGRDIDAVFAAGVDATLRDVVRAGDPSAMARAVEAEIDAALLIPPQLASSAATPPSGEAWQAEVKLDGFRLVALKEGAVVRLVTRNGQNWTHRFGAVARAVAALPATSAALDGEVVIYDTQGRSDLGALQRALGRGARSSSDAAGVRAVYVAFDLMHLAGWDLRACALGARREALRLLLCRRSQDVVNDALRFSEHFADGAGLFREACALGLEGIVAKRVDAPWVSGRSRSWVKVKCVPEAADGVTIDRKPDVAVRPARPRAVTIIGGVRVTHPDKVLFPDLGITKGELAEYYQAVAPLVVAYARQRPLSLVRCPSGVRSPCFYQKHAVQGVPAAIPRVIVDDDREPYLMIDSAESLLSLVHFGVVELHVWGCRADKLERPDLIVMDLDPAPDVPWSRVARTALALKEQLEVLGLTPFLRATGGKGLHVVAPLRRRATWDQVKTLTHDLARAFAQRDPKHFTAELAKHRRAGKVFIDYLRNTRHATAVASWSVRARDGAPVAMPLAWDELDLKHGPPTRNLREVLALIARPGWQDPWADFESSRRPVTKAMCEAVASLSA